jgi:hypothetical protein
MGQSKRALAMTRSGLIEREKTGLGAVGRALSPTSGDDFRSRKRGSLAIKGRLAHRRETLLDAFLPVETIHGSRSFGLGDCVMGAKKRLKQVF